MSDREDDQLKKTASPDGQGAFDGISSKSMSNLLDDGFDLFESSSIAHNFHSSCDLKGSQFGGCNGFNRPMGSQTTFTSMPEVKVAPLNFAAKPLPHFLEPARHAGEWRSEGSHEKGSYWTRANTPRPLRGFGIGAMIAPPNCTIPNPTIEVPLRTVWMPVNGLAHYSSLSILETDVDDHHHFIRRFDDPPCAFVCLQHIMSDLPLGRYGICPLHERVIPHPKPPPAIPMGESNLHVRCTALNAISPIFFHVHRNLDFMKLHRLAEMFEEQEMQIMKHVLHYPVQGGYAVCRHQNRLHRCRINTIGMEANQVDLIDLGSSAIIPHEELYTMPTDIASFSAPLSFKCSLIEQDTRLLDFKSTSSFNDLIMSAAQITLEVHGGVTSDGKHLVRLIHPAPPEKPKDPFAGRGTHNRRPKFKVEMTEDTEDVVDSVEEDFNSQVAGFRNSDDEFDDFIDYEAMDFKAKEENLFF